MYRLNFSLLTLVLKEPNVVSLDRFRPLAMINCSFKIFAKCAANKLGPVCNDLISPNQTAFIKGRFILESVVMAHEVIHEIHRSGSSGLILKLDYEKAYDRVSWDFLKEMLLSRGFGSKWVGWVMSTIHQGTSHVSE